MSLVFERDAWRRYFANDVNYFILPTLEEQNDSITLLQDAKSAVSRGVPGGVNDAAG